MSEAEMRVAEKKTRKAAAELSERAERITELMKRRERYLFRLEAGETADTEGEGRELLIATAESYSREAQLRDDIEGADNEIDMLADELEPLLEEAGNLLGSTAMAGQKSESCELLKNALASAQAALELCSYED